MSEIAPASSTPHEIKASSSGRLLTREEFFGLSKVPPEAEWFADIQNPNTRRAYGNDVKEFRTFLGIEEVTEFRIVKRPHILAWRKELEGQGKSASTIRRKLSALSSLFSFLCDENAIEVNPVSGVSRPKEKSVQTPALSDEQVKRFLEAPDPDKEKAPSRKLKAWRDQAIISVMSFHGLRCSEMTGLRVKDLTEQRGVKFFTVHGKGSKIRYVPIRAHSIERIEDYLTVAGHGEDREAFLFQSVRTKGNQLSQQAVFEGIMGKYALEVGINPHEVCIHSFRVTSATNAVEHGGTIEEVRDWLGHSSISTTDGYIRTRVNPDESPTFRVKY